jgi:hypothetical protein
MKKIAYLLAFILILTAFRSAHAQGGFSDVIKVSPGDATKLIQAYGEPLFKGFGVGMNSGWTNTAKPKKLLHFELKFSTTAAFAPASDKSFDVTKIGLSNGVGPTNPNNTIAPTIAGERGSDGPELNVYDANHQVVDQFYLPSGKLPVLPTPQLQLTVGLIDGTDVTVRGFPTVNFGGDVGKVSSIGFALKHDLTQYIFGRARILAPFNLSILAAYSRLNLNDNLNIQPDQGATHDPTDANTNTDFSTQQTQAHFNSFLGQLIISKKLLFFTPFAAVGYNTASTHFAAVGNYPVTTRENLITGHEYYTVYTDPVDINQTSISGFRSDIGFQLNFGFSLYVAYSVAQYSSVTAGFGLSF